MKLTRRGKVAATIATVAIAVGLFTAGAQTAGPDEMMGHGIAGAIDQTVETTGLAGLIEGYVCGEALDGMPGTACYLTADSPAAMGHLNR